MNRAHWYEWLALFALLALAAYIWLSGPIPNRTPF